MNYWLFLPHPKLRPHVHSYFLAEPRPGGAHHPDFRERELILPDGQAEIIFRGEGCYERSLLPEPDKVQLVDASHVIAGRTASAVTRDLGDVSLAGVRLNPWLLGEILRTSLNRIPDELVSLRAVGATRLYDLEEAALSCRSPGELGARLDAFFLAELARTRACDPSITGLRQAIERENGSIPILDWAKTHALDVRTMERRFAAAFGMTPKRYARIVRFRHAYRVVMRSGSGRIATDIDGFYDQSHFLKEFRYFAGGTPKLRGLGSEAPGFSISDHQIGLSSQAG